MKKNLILFLLFLSCFDCFPQIKVTGTLIDSLSKIPIQYSRITFGDPNNVVLSDKNGSFEISFIQAGNLEIRNLQYEPKEYQINQNTNLGSVLFTKQVYMLPLFSYSPVITNLKAGEYNKKPIIKGIKKRNHIRTKASMILSLYVNPPSIKDKTLYIDTLNYYIYDSSADGCPFRVQVYEAIQNSDGTISHGKPFILENIILSFPNFEGWVKVDIKKYGIKIPSNGVFVSIEFLKHCNYEIKMVNGIKPLDSFGWKENCLNIPFSKRSKSKKSQWTLSGKRLTEFKIYGYKIFGDQNNFGFSNTGNPLIYINYSIY
jgi:hypothetical protein